MMKNRNTGFTLLELMIVVAIVAVMSAIGIPYMGDFIKNNRIKSTMFDVLDTLNMARGEAVKRKASVTICRANADMNACANGTDWSDGWLVCIESDCSGGEDPIRIGNPARGTVNIQTAAANSITYRPDGTSRRNADETEVTRLAICDERGEDWGRQIDVMLVGRANVNQGRPGTPISDCTAPN